MGRGVGRTQTWLGAAQMCLGVRNLQDVQVIHDIPDAHMGSGPHEPGLHGPGSTWVRAHMTPGPDFKITLKKSKVNRYTQTSSTAYLINFIFKILPQNGYIHMLCVWFHVDLHKAVLSRKRRRSEPASSRPGLSESSL